MLDLVTVGVKLVDVELRRFLRMEQDLGGHGQSRLCHDAHSAALPGMAIQLFTRCVGSSTAESKVVLSKPH